MIVTMNGIEYTTSVSDGVTTVQHGRGSFTTLLSESEALKEYILSPLRKEREVIFQEQGWRVHSANYPYDDQQDWIDYFVGLRDFTNSYVEGEDILLPDAPE